MSDSVALTPNLYKGLIDIAIGKTASQSSMSQWSHQGEASIAISGHMPRDFAFHTAQQKEPWWLVDLEASYPLELIVISNRVGACWERCKTMRVEVSTNKEEWTLLHAGLTVFGSRTTDDAFTLWLKGIIEARYLRVKLDADEQLHLSQVEIFVKPDARAFAEFCHVNGLSNLSNINKNLPHPYEVVHGMREGQADAAAARIVGLDLSYSARFGNLLIQYINAILLAQRTGLKYIRLGHHSLLAVKDSFEAHGIRFIPQHDALSSDGYFLRGDFFVSDPFVPVLMPFLRFTAQDESDFTFVTREIIRKHMLTGVPLVNEVRADDEVTIHLRSGDVFAPFSAVVRGYRQPPLSFYKRVFDHLSSSFGVKRVRLVFEDRGNPCVDALEAWLAKQGITYRVQCGSLADDMSALIDAPHLVFGHGTFGYAACRLSRRIQTVHYFEPELGGYYRGISSIDRVFSVYDSRGDYIKAFEYGKPFADEAGWFNTEHDRAMMLSYPIEGLSIAETRVGDR